MTLALNTFLDDIKTIFDDANTTTATHDLSNGMNDRVQRVMTINPSKIPVQASFYPYVTLHIDGKTIEKDSIAKSQAGTKRKATVDVNIVGGVFEDNTTDVDEDSADREINKLMENIEEILRNNDTANNNATWAFPTEVRYNTLQLSEETHVRIALMTYEMMVYY